MPKAPSVAEIQANRLEWAIDAIGSLAPAFKKRLILDARAPEVAILTDEQAQGLIAALGLGPA